MRYLVTCSALLLLLGGCATKEFPPSTSRSDIRSQQTLPTDITYSDTPDAEPEQRPAPLEDLLNYPQDAWAYADNIKPHAPDSTLQQNFEARWFAPWNYTKPPQSLEAIRWPFESYRSDNAYGENLQPLPQEWFDKMLENSNFDAYGSVNGYAISLRFSSLRNFPTNKPLFKNPSEAGEGFPFDYVQNSGVHANEPLFVSHYSRDGAWVYVFATHATGWLRSDEIAYIPTPHTQRWQEARQVYVIKEGSVIKDSASHFLFRGRVGMMLPLIAEEDGDYRVLAVTAGPNGEGWYNEAHIARDAVSTTALQLDSWNLPRIANEMLSSLYGWGGLYEDRDCSSTLRDLFAPFGIWLPRNSYQQSQVGKVISLEGMTPSEKIERIKAEGVPFETLLYRKGHIVLYLGTYDGDVVILQNLWGVKTKIGEIPGRRIVGHTVISTLYLGAELPDYDEENAFVTQLESMNVITLPAEDKGTL